MTTQNPWADFLDYDEPGRKAAYFARRDQFGGGQRSQRQSRFYQDSFSQLYNNYLGNLGRQVTGGGAPTDSWAKDYLGGFNFDDYYRQNVPYEERNAGQNAFTPQAVWRVLNR